MLKEITDEIIAVLKTEQVASKRLDLETILDEKLDEVSFNHLVILG